MLNNSNLLILKKEDREILGKIVKNEKQKNKLKIEFVGKGTLPFIQVKDELEVGIPTKDGIYVFNSSVIYFDVIDRYIIIEYPTDIEKTNRRNYERHNIHINLEVIIEGEIYKAISSDIGGGGVGFYTAHNIEKGKTVIMNFQLGKHKYEGILGIIKSEMDTVHKNIKRYGIEYTNLEDDIREDILLKIFELNNN
ncbi:c-di-GMP-binding flagellar brake protein YcgR [Hypnocyclicus thermotrophus]|uniref:C-di-GMP-binding flagellar brake protein YcgR n=1 Tax=Hypnocyclicus thermotrophus TaxID=1627895 RepID=A0AA46I4U7_9FUSO|nr:PilZ domain-containing protein [Hypnocyclicus thermotrophus]TDT67414.1 c-di-GMP-binding flagellar brake protein YcgR [Hypnocyclicus thermotrophus]